MEFRSFLLSVVFYMVKKILTIRMLSCKEDAKNIDPIGVLISVLLVIFSGIVLYAANSGFEKCLKHIMMKSIVNQGNNNE